MSFSHNPLSPSSSSSSGGGGGSSTGGERVGPGSILNSSTPSSSTRVSTSSFVGGGSASNSRRYEGGIGSPLPTPLSLSPSVSFTGAPVIPPPVVMPPHPDSLTSSPHTAGPHTPIASTTTVYHHFYASPSAPYPQVQPPYRERSPAPRVIGGGVVPPPPPYSINPFYVGGVGGIATPSHPPSTPAPVTSSITHSGQWEVVEPSEGSVLPCQRSLHAGAVWRDYFIVFGGYDGIRRVNDLYAFSFKTNLWQSLSNIDAPSPRDRHVAVVHDDHFYVFGGFDGLARVNGKSLYLCDNLTNSSLF